MENFVKATFDDAAELAGLAEIIWREHYTPIIGKDQVEYMLENFQSREVIGSQINEGEQSYYLIKLKSETIGYFSIKPQNNMLFLSKVYILKPHRNKGIGKTVFHFITNEARTVGLNGIYLTVNKNNKNSIKAYENMGLKKESSAITDIGNGYVMDDYIMSFKFE